MSIHVKITGDHPHSGVTGTIPTSKPFEELPEGLLKVEFGDGGGFIGKENLEVIG